MKLAMVVSNVRRGQMQKLLAASNAIVFDLGDEVMEGLEGFARAQGLDGAHFTAIGAFSDATLGYFDWERKENDGEP